MVICPAFDKKRIYIMHVSPIWSMKYNTSNDDCLETFISYIYVVIICNNKEIGSWFRQNKL